MLGRLLTALLVLALVGAAVVGGGYLKLRQWGAEPVRIDGERLVEFPAGTTLMRLAQALEDESLVSQGSLFYAWVRLFEPFEAFKAGRYRFTGQVTPHEIAAAIVKGDTYNPIVLSIAIPEGWPLRSVIERLAANQVGALVELKHLANDPAFLKSVNVPSTNLEGFLYPATYNFTAMPTATDAFTQMVKTFWSHLPKDYEKSVQARGLTLQQAVTFASMIETETLNEDEKALISEVIWRRLKDGMPLGIDAALIYGIPGYDGDLKWADLANADNPYNTRVHKGLPPTPIGATSIKSLEAVLTPSNFGYYFYVLIPGTQRHHFSKTLKEHNEHVRILVKATRKTSNGPHKAKHGKHKAADLPLKPTGEAPVETVPPPPP